MKTLVTSSGLMALFTSAALAGGIDRSGQWITPIFEPGDTVTFSVGSVDPEVTGSLGTNDATTRYNPMSFSVKKAITEQVDVAVIVDQPFGANIKYTSGLRGHAHWPVCRRLRRCFQQGAHLCGALQI